MVVMTFCALLLASCQGGPSSYDEGLEVSVKNTSVDSAKGQMFVSVKSSSSWTLSLSDAETHSSVDWATLSITSGNGNANNIILSYQANTGEQNRVLRITISITTAKEFKDKSLYLNLPHMILLSNICREAKKRPLK